MKNKKSFTLIELLVVIAIIGLLSTIVLVSLQGVRARARDARRKEELKSMQTAMEAYYDINNSFVSGTYFSCWDKIDWAETTTTNPNGLVNALIGNNLLPKLPFDPINKEGGTANYLGDGPLDLCYYYWSDGQNYKLGCNLEEGGPSPDNYGNFQIKNY